MPVRLPDIRAFPSSTRDRVEVLQKNIRMISG